MVDGDDRRWQNQRRRRYSQRHRQTRLGATHPDASKPAAGFGRAVARTHVRQPHRRTQPIRTLRVESYDHACGGNIDVIHRRETAVETTRQAICAGRSQLYVRDLRDHQRVPCSLPRDNLRDQYALVSAPRSLPKQARQTSCFPNQFWDRDLTDAQTSRRSAKLSKEKIENRTCHRAERPRIEIEIA